MADANADQKTDVTNVADGDRVLVQAGVPKRTTYAEGAEAIAARKLVDKTNPTVEDDFRSRRSDTLAPAPRPD